MVNYKLWKVIYSIILLLGIACFFAKTIASFVAGGVLVTFGIVFLIILRKEEKAGI